MSRTGDTKARSPVRGGGKERKKALWRPQVLVIALALTGMAVVAMFLGYVDLAQMALVAIGTALGKLV